jgi:DNA/RNA-binding protein KIN17
VGLVVKVMNREVADGAYYRLKGRVVGVEHEGWAAHVSLLDSGDELLLDAADVETVLPALGGTVCVLRGAGTGARAELLEIDVDRFSASVRVLDGPLKGAVLRGVAYEDICKTDDTA